MNAQSDFKQFVSSNKGNLITFKHQDWRKSKYVVDVYAEYFTGKSRQTDAKIDGFYYFDECEIYKPTLVETLAYHRHVVLIGDKSPMPDAFFEYKDYKVVNDILMVNGKQLSFTTPEVSYTACYIREVWAIVEGKYTQVWKKENGFINTENVNQKISTEDRSEKEIKKQKVQWYNDKADDWVDFCRKCGSMYGQNFIEVIEEIKSKPYSEELYDGLCLSYQYLRDWVLKTFKNDRKNPRVQALAKRFLILTNEFRKNFDTKDINHLVELIDVEISFEGVNEYERMFKKVKENTVAEHVNIEYRGKVKTVEIIDDNALINKKEYVLAKDCKDGTPMALLKKNVKYGDIVGAFEDKPVNIEYKGKAKTVEIMKEYTQANGKEYVLVKDLTDNGKTKTLFKEYIKYM